MALGQVGAFDIERARFYASEMVIGIGTSTPPLADIVLGRWNPVSSQEQYNSSRFEARQYIIEGRWPYCHR